MAEQRSIGLVQLRAPFLALGAVGLRQGDRDHAVVVARRHLRRLRRVGEKLEDEAMLGVFRPRLHGKVPPQQSIEQAVFREFELSPRRKVGGVRDVGDRVIVPARDP